MKRLDFSLLSVGELAAKLGKIPKTRFFVNAGPFTMRVIAG